MATRTYTPLRDVPQAITVVTRAMIADQSMQGLADVVRYVPGVGAAQGEGNRDTRCSAATARRRTSSSTACATTCSTSGTCTTWSAWRRSRGRTR